MDLVIKMASDRKFEKDIVSIKEIIDTLKLLGWEGRFIVSPYLYDRGEIKIIIYNNFIA